jgi:hypothetical protein
MSPQPLAASLNCNLVRGNSHTAAFVCSAAGQINLHRFDNLATSKYRSRTSTAEENLINIVVKDETKLLLIVTTECYANSFRNRIANRIGMANAFPFDDFNFPSSR